MSTVAWHLEHSVEAGVSATFAWTFWTDVRNWDDPPATFRLDGPFLAGSWGTTLIPGRDALRWHIRDVMPYRSFVIELPIDPAATLSFEWVFESLSDRRTRLTQHIRLSGSNAAAHADQVRAGFSATLQDGMARIARNLAAAESVSRSS